MNKADLEKLASKMADYFFYRTMFWTCLILLGGCVAMIWKLDNL